MQECSTKYGHTKYLRKIRVAIILVSIVGVLSSFPIALTTFVYAISAHDLFLLLLFPALVLSTILFIANFRVGGLLMLLTAVGYGLVLASDVGEFLVFNVDNSVLFAVLLLPYIAFLTLIPLTVIYLTQNLRQRNVFKAGSIVIAAGFFVFAIADRARKDYVDRIFINAEISSDGQIKLNCKPGFADSRTFFVTTKSEQLEKQIRKYGEYYQGSYFLYNAEVFKNFNFTKLNSITIKRIGRNKLEKDLTWTRNELNGDTGFLQP